VPPEADRRVLDLLQSRGPCIELALVGPVPLKCVVPEAFEYILRARNVSGETREVKTAFADSARRSETSTSGGSGGACDDQRQGKSKSIHFSEPEPHAELQRRSPPPVMILPKFASVRLPPARRIAVC